MICVIRDGVADRPKDKTLLFECLDDSKTRSCRVQKMHSSQLPSIIESRQNTYNVENRVDHNYKYCSHLRHYWSNRHSSNLWYLLNLFGLTQWFPVGLIQEGQKPSPKHLLMGFSVFVERLCTWVFHTFGRTKIIHSALLKKKIIIIIHSAFPLTIFFFSLFT